MRLRCFSNSLATSYFLPVMLGLVRVYRRQRQSLPRLDPVARVVGFGWRVLHHELLRRPGLNSLAGVFLRVAVLIQNTPSRTGNVPGSSDIKRESRPIPLRRGEGYGSFWTKIERASGSPRA